MEAIKLSLAGMKFSPNQAVSKEIIKLPCYSDILSVTVKKNDAYIWIHYMTPVSSLKTNTEDWDEFEFVIGKYNNSEFVLNSHEYLSTIVFEKNNFAVFYKKL